MKEKITLAFQHWNKEYDWYNPNGHPEDWIINGQKEFPFSHGEYYFNLPKNFNIYDLSFDSIEKLNITAKKNDHLYKKTYIEFKLLDDIPKNHRYLFPIIIHKIDYFYAQDIISLKYIPQRVIDDVKNNFAKIIFYFPYEGNISVTNGEFGEYRNFGSMILNMWCENFGLEKDHVYFINANLLSNEFNSKTTNCTLVGVDTFIDWIPKEYIYQPLVEFKPKDSKYLFLSYNRNVRTHRKILLLNLLKEDLFNSGIVSCGSAFNPHLTKPTLEKFKAEYLEPYIKNINQLAPIHIDINLHNNNPACQITKEHYESTFISLVTETHFEKDVLFRSEKIFKPIVMGHPFIVLASQYFLKDLKKLGFKTFDKWIDESYDNEPDLIKRIQLITDEIKKLTTKTVEELNNIRNEMKSNLLYNKKLFKLYYEQDKNGLGFFDNEIRKIWNTLKKPTVTMIGCGKLGLPCTEVMSAYYDVNGYDINQLKRNTHIKIKSSISEAIKESSIIFIAVPTPHEIGYDGSIPTSDLEPKDFDYSIVESVLTEIVENINDEQIIVLISTVLPGTIRNRFEKIFKNKKFIYNPYLIAMGSVKWDMINPECLIIGTKDGSITAEAQKLIDFYKPLMQNNPRINVGTWDEAESIKIFYNTFISAKIGLVNMIQDVAEKNGNINVDIVTDALKHATQRITGPKYLTAGMGDGGSCHPRDNIALRYLANKLDLGYDLFQTIMSSREIQAKNIALRLIELSKQYDLPIVIHGKSYKPYVPYVDGSYSLLIGYFIEEAGYKVAYADPLTGDFWEGKAVILMAHNASVTYDKDDTIKNKEKYYFNIEPRSVILDPWRSIHNIDNVTIIQYGNTRLK